MKHEKKKYSILLHCFIISVYLVCIHNIILLHATNDIRIATAYAHVLRRRGVYISENNFISFSSVVCVRAACMCLYL